MQVVLNSNFPILYTAIGEQHDAGKTPLIHAVLRSMFLENSEKLQLYIELSVLVPALNSATEAIAGGELIEQYRTALLNHLFENLKPRVPVKDLDGEMYILSKGILNKTGISLLPYGEE